MWLSLSMLLQLGTYGTVGLSLMPFAAHANVLNNVLRDCSAHCNKDNMSLGDADSIVTQVIACLPTNVERSSATYQSDISAYNAFYNLFFRSNNNHHVTVQSH
jgi:hypothetical protein